MSATRSMSLTDDRGGVRLGALSMTISRPAIGLGVILVALSMLLSAMGVLGLTMERFYRAYLFAYMWGLSICLGSLFFVMLQHCVKAGWSVVVRRIAEGIASNLTWLWIFFIPIAIGMWTDHLYEWTTIEAPEHGALPAKYLYYLTPMFWTIRAVIFHVIWALLARFFISTSIAQDATGEVSLTRRMERFAPLSMMLYAISQSFAAMDWVMSLESAWFSTMFPVYYFAASCCGAFAALILMCYRLQRSDRMTSEVTAEHYHDLGKLLFAFGIVFWSYIAFSQYMLIWYANIPEETPWYLVRQVGGWLPVSILLLVGHFAAPFLALISRHPKRMPPTLAIAAAWMLFMSVVDVYWLTMPRVPDEMIHDAATYRQFTEAVTPAEIGYGFSMLDATCLFGLAALLIGGVFWRLGSCSLIPQQDPRLHESLAFENV
jgi:hypothetical protein